jgi:hypothetical protein
MEMSLDEIQAFGRSVWNSARAPTIPARFMQAAPQAKAQPQESRILNG